MSGFNRVQGKTSRGMILQSCMGVLAALTSSGVLMQCGGCPLFPSPTLGVNAGPDLSLSLNTSADITATTSNAEGNVSYDWDIISGPALTGADDGVTVTVACGSTAGTTVLRVTATDEAGCIATDEVSITCSGTPPGVINVNAGVDQSAVQGQTVVLVATVTGGTAPVSFSWLLTGTGSAGTASIVNANTQTPSVTFSGDALGTFTFSVTVTDANGNTDTDTVSVTVGVAPPTPGSLAFTLDIDDLMGSSGDDVFTAPLVFASGIGLLPTLQTGDAADGLAGIDSLNATLNDDGGATITPMLSGIEIHNYNAQDNMSIDAANIVGATTINTLNSAGDLVVFNLGNLVSAGITNSDADLELDFDAEAVEGTADALNLSVNGVDSTFISGGIETLNIDSAGGDDNILEVDLGADLTGINVTGAAALDLGDLGANNPNVEALDASGSTGGVTATASPTDFTFLGGPGDDQINFDAGEFDENDAADGGAGTDTLGLGSADAEAISTAGDELEDIANFEALAIIDAIGGDIDLPLFNVATLIAEAGITGAATITVESGNTVTLQDDATAATTLEIEENGISDSVNINLEDADITAGLTLDGVEVANLDVSDAATTISSVIMNPSDPPGPAIGTSTLNITGDQDVTINSATVQTINASSLTGDLTVDGANNAISITGGSGDDDLTGSTDGDAISGGAGDDTITGDEGEDSLTGGADADTFVFDTGDSGEPAATTFDEITDFEEGVDIIDYDPADLVVVTNATASAGEAAINAEGIASFAAADDTLAERIVAVEAGIVAGGNVDGAFAIFESGGNSFIFISDGDDGIDSDDVLIRLNSVTGLSDTTITGGNLTAE